MNHLNNPTLRYDGTAMLSWSWFHYFTAILFTLIISNLLGSPRCNMFHFCCNNTVWPAWLKSHCVLSGPCSHPPCNNKQEPRKKPLCFGVNPDRRVHTGILIYGDCWVLTLPAVLVDSALCCKVWRASFRLKGKMNQNKMPFLIEAEGLLAIFSAKSKMADLCPFWPEVRCQGSDVGRPKWQFIFSANNTVI